MDDSRLMATSSAPVVTQFMRRRPRPVATPSKARLGLGRIHDVDVGIRDRGNDALRLEGGVDRAGEIETVRPAQAARRHSQTFDRRGPVIEKAQSRKIQHRRAGRHAQCLGLVEGRVAVFERQDARAGDQAPHPGHLRKAHERRQAVADLAAAHLPAAAFVRLEEAALGEHLQGPPHGEARESQRVAERALRRQALSGPQGAGFDFTIERRGAGFVQGRRAERCERRARAAAVLRPGHGRSIALVAFGCLAVQQ